MTGKFGDFFPLREKYPSPRVVFVAKFCLPIVYSLYDYRLYVKRFYGKKEKNEKFD
jgi:hypothetical protein